VEARIALGVTRLGTKKSAEAGLIWIRERLKAANRMSVEEPAPGRGGKIPGERIWELGPHHGGATEEAITSLGGEACGKLKGSYRSRISALRKKYQTASAEKINNVKKGLQIYISQSEHARKGTLLSGKGFWVQAPSRLELIRGGSFSRLRKGRWGGG